MKIPTDVLLTFAAVCWVAQSFPSQSQLQSSSHLGEAGNVFSTCGNGEEYIPELSICRTCGEDYYILGGNSTCQRCPSHRTNRGTGNEHCHLFKPIFPRGLSIAISSFCGLVTVLSFAYHTQHGGSFAVLVANGSIAFCVTSCSFYLSDSLFSSFAVMAAAISAFFLPHVVLLIVLSYFTNWRKLVLYCGPLQEHLLIQKHHHWIYRSKMNFNFLPSGIALFLFVLLWPMLRILYLMVVFCICLKVQLVQLFFGWALCLSGLLSDLKMNNMFWESWVGESSEQTRFNEGISVDVLAALLAVWTGFGLLPLFVIQLYNNQNAGWSDISYISITACSIIIVLTTGHSYYTFRRHFPSVSLDIRTSGAARLAQNVGRRRSRDVEMTPRPLVPSAVYDTDTTWIPEGHPRNNEPSSPSSRPRSTSFGVHRVAAEVHISANQQYPESFPVRPQSIRDHYDPAL